MADLASVRLGKPVRKLVMTVPANFNNGQKQATKDACQIAGLECVHIITEPVAAAVAYSTQMNLPEDGESVVVFDFGGGTLDIAALFISTGVI